MRLLATLIAGGLFIVDRLAKGYFLLHTTEQIDLIPSMLWLQYHLNDKMALSLPLWPLLYYTLVTFVILGLCAKLVALYQQRQAFLLVVVAVTLAGAISNLLDRLLYGGVVDFIVVSLGSVFNIADMMIVGSILTWIITLSYGNRQKAV